MTSDTAFMMQGGYLLILAVILPAVAVLAIIVAGGRHARKIVRVELVLGTAVALAICYRVGIEHRAILYVVGGWEPPLGIALRADGLAATMTLLAALIVSATAIYALEAFGTAH